MKTNVYGFQPKTCWIVHMKGIYNIPVQVANNRHSADKRKKPCLGSINRRQPKRPLGTL